MQSMKTAVGNSCAPRLRTISPGRRVLGSLVRLGLLCAPVLLSLAGCGSNPKSDPVEMPAAEVRPKVEPKARSGNMRSYVVHGKRYYTKASSQNHVERGLASWYGRKFHGRKTSSGERYDMHQMTAAHKTLPLPTYALVTNLDNGRRAVVRINDRGPFVHNRVIDLSYAAAKRLDMVQSGTARVEVRSIDPRDHGGESPLRIASAEPAKRGPVQRSSDIGIAATPAAAKAQASAAPVYLQLGAFDSRGNAEQLRDQVLAAVDAPVHVRTARSGFAADSLYAADALYKVQVGPLDSERDADTLGRRLAALGIEKPMVVGP